MAMAFVFVAVIFASLPTGRAPHAHAVGAPAPASALGGSVD
ncbi:MAG TPA: hypothetical protein VGL09_09600 [Methylomirabilota bacterium]